MTTDGHTPTPDPSQLPDPPVPGADHAAADRRALRRARARGAVAGAVGVAALGTAGVVGISAARAVDTPTPSPSSSTAPSTPGAESDSTAPDENAPGTRGPGGHRGGPGGFGGPGSLGFGPGADLSTLAEKLGVTEDALKAAATTVRDDLKAQREAAKDSTDGTTRPDPETMRSEMAAALAKELGIDEAKVTQALEDLRTAAEADRTKAFDDRLAQAVEDGKLTQAEADAVKKAAEAGVIPKFGGPGPR